MNYLRRLPSVDALAGQLTAETATGLPAVLAVELARRSIDAARSAALEGKHVDPVAMARRDAERLSRGRIRRVINATGGASPHQPREGAAPSRGCSRGPPGRAGLRQPRVRPDRRPTGIERCLPVPPAEPADRGRGCLGGEQQRRRPVSDPAHPRGGWLGAGCPAAS